MMEHTKSLHVAGGLFWLLLFVSGCLLAAASDAGSGSSPFQYNHDAVPTAPVGNVKVKGKAARFLAAGNTISSTHGDLKIQGFNAHMKLHNLTLGTSRAAGIKDTKHVKMPFTGALERISTLAAASSLRSHTAPRANFFIANGDTPEERRNRILNFVRILTPCLQRRILLIRSQQKAKQESDAEGLQPLRSNAPEDEEKNRLRAENDKLHRTIRALAFAVRGLIWRSRALTRKLQESKQSSSDNDENTDEASDDKNIKENSSSEQGASGLIEKPRPFVVSPTDGPQAFNVRRAFLLHQYPTPAPVSSMN